MDEEHHNENIVIAGVVYPLDHLSSTRHKVAVLLQGKYPKDIPVTVSYTMHTYCRGLRSGESVSHTHKVLDGKHVRVFCARRYALSRRLPALMAKFLQGRNPFHLVDGGNYLRIEDLEGCDGEFQPIVYHVIFRMRKHVVGERYIHLRVETAYPEDLINYPPVRFGRKPFYLTEVLHDLWMPRERRTSNGAGKARKGKRGKESMRRVPRCAQD